jgi:hypothetical protein
MAGCPTSRDFREVGLADREKRWPSQIGPQAGGPILSVVDLLLFHKRNEGVPSLRFLQGWAAMLLPALTFVVYVHYYMSL